MLRASSKTKGGPCMLYAGLDLSRKRLDFRLLDQAGETIEAGAVPPDADGLRGLAGRVARFAEPVRAAIERARWRLHLVRHRSGLKQRVHAVLLAHGQPCPVSDLFGASGRALLARLALPEPWASTVAVSLRLIDELDREIVALERELRRLGADHRYVPLLLTIPGIGWVLAYTIAAELGDIARFASPTKLAGYTGLCPRSLPIRRLRPARPALQTRPPLPPLGADRSDHPRLQAPALPRPLPAHQDPARQPTRAQGRPGRPRPPARRSDLAHAHPRPALRSGRRHEPPGRLTTLKEMRHRSEPPIPPDPPAEEAIER